jgi:hypothetical protein
MVSMGHSSLILQAHPVLSGLRLEVLRTQGEVTTSGSPKFSPSVAHEREDRVFPTLGSIE